MSPQITPPKPRTIVIAIAVPVLLMLVGAGCMSSLGQKANDVGNELGNEAVQPIAVSVDALKKAKEVTAEQNAKMHEDADRVADDLTIGMIVTENAAVPAGAEAVPGTIGCNDRVAYTKVHRETSTDEVLADALNTLFAQKDSNVNGLYNALWQSSLKVDKITSNDADTTDVWLKGVPTSGGTCDDPRIKAQIEATISRLRPKFRIYLNGSEEKYKCIGDMSGKCSTQ